MLKLYCGYTIVLIMEVCASHVDETCNAAARVQIVSIFKKLPVFMRQWEKENAVLYQAEVPLP
jgi:hypothetical protein